VRSAFVESLIKVAKADPRVFLLTGDLGYSALEPFCEEFPERFLNLGVAEQSMTGFAAGLSLSGKVPVVYSIATFICMKAFEQIRNDICYQNLDIKIVGVGSGLTYSQYGATHHSVEDIALMRTLPNLKIICPGDPIEAGKGVEAMLRHPGPFYLRLGGKGEPMIHEKGVKFQIGKGIIVREGKEIALVTTGNMLANTVTAAQLLKEHGLTPRVVSMHTIKPLDLELLEDTFSKFTHIFTIEEHSIIGGLGAAVAEVIAERLQKPFNFFRVALPDKFQEVGGWLHYMRESNNLSPQAIVRNIIQKYKD
jgi:transketolase